MNINFNIEEFLSLEGYATSDRVSRRKGSGGTNEFFTPYSLVKKMADKIPEETWNDPSKTFLEPSMGNGNFVVYIIYNKIMHGSSWQQALETTYGVELMEDNVLETHERILELLKLMEINFDENKAKEIINKNLVCSDFFKWDFENWQPIKEIKSNALF